MVVRTRVWFNHWFSTAYRLMELIKQEDNSIDLIGSSRVKNAIYKTICEEFYEEPIDISDEMYNNWCIDFCRKHSINVFVPRRGRTIICKNLKRYDEIGVKVLIDDNPHLLNMLDNKVKTAEFFKKHNICSVPEMYVVNTVSEFEIAYRKVKDKCPNDRVCIKYNNDEGAVSFRVIDNVVNSIKSLRSGIGLKLSYESVISMLSERDSFDDLIVMPYLNGLELSIDSLMTHKGFIGLTRCKVGTRGTEVYYDDELYKISKKFAEISGIKMPYNLQVRWHNDRMYLLEVNARMAGGTHKSCLTGINIPYIAYCELVGKDFDLPYIKTVKRLLVSEIETPIILN